MQERLKREFTNRAAIAAMGWWPVLALLFFVACSGPRSAYNPSRKIPAEELRQDFDLMRHLLETYHPSLYWYTPKDSMDLCFEQYRAAITDSMTDTQFGFRIIAPVTTRIRCGHTSFSYSKKHNRFFEDVRIPSFPLFLKIWGDTMIVTSNLDRRDSLLTRGTQVTAINGMDARKLADTLFHYMPTDGYSDNVNQIRLSSAFPYYYRNIMGLQKAYPVSYLDSTGRERYAMLPLFVPKRDTTRHEKGREKAPREKRPDRKERLEFFRSLSIDTARNAAVMSVSTFDDGGNLRSFYKKSFRKIREMGISNLVIDIRNNGGGKVNHYTQLAQYIRNTPFKVADSAYSVRRSFGADGKYFSSRFFNGLGLFFFTSKRKDSLYHFRYWEDHAFKPKKNNHFDGKVWVLVSGPTFSAATLFCHTVHDQENVRLLGEETGGGHHGNNGLMIPNVTLPHTGIRVRMPLFRIVQYNHPPKDGRGVIPDIIVPPSADAVRKGIDRKMQTVLSIIETEGRSKSN
jgi:Peptidase family S41